MIKFIAGVAVGIAAYFAYQVYYLIKYESTPENPPYWGIDYEEPDFV